MQALNIYCAGAAKAVVSRAIAAYRRETGGEVEETYGAVGFLKNRMLEGGKPDLVILSEPLIRELTAAGLLQGGSAVALGAVGTGVAVRAGVPLPSVVTEDQLRQCLLQATTIICPDPAVASAGQVLIAALGTLGIADQVAGRLVYSASGYAGMDQLTQGKAADEVGIMQMTEIAACETVVLAGPLPASLQKLTIYAAAVTTDAGVAADAFLARITGDVDALRKAGFQPV